MLSIVSPFCTVWIIEPSGCVETEVVLTITPHVVRSLTTPSIANQSFWSGTDQNYATTQLFPPYARTVSQTSSTGVPATAPSPVSQEQAVPGTAEIPPASPTPLPGVHQAAGAASTQAPGETLAPDLLARAPGLLTLRPTDFSTVVGQEFRVDVSTAKLDALTESLVTISYDPRLIEFRRVGPGAAAISARTTDGQVTLTMRRQGTGGAGESVLALLFFQAKAKGDAMLTMDATPSAPGTPGAPSAARAVIHVQ